LALGQRISSYFCLNIKTLALILKHNINALTDEELVDRCIKDDRMAQHALFYRYASVMLGICFRYAYNKQEAEDMMQEGFVLVFKSLKAFKFQSALKTWMTRIMINNAINYNNKHHKIKWDFNLAPLDNHETFSETQLHLYDSKVVMEAVQQLPLGYRMVLNLYAIEGYSHKDVAEQLNIKEATSRSQYAKAKVLLQKILVKYGINIPEHGTRSV
jgi:RNA polymerase sigma factor (sigma-70 family)